MTDVAVLARILLNHIGVLVYEMDRGTHLNVFAYKAVAKELLDCLDEAGPIFSLDEELRLARLRHIVNGADYE